MAERSEKKYDPNEIHYLDCDQQKKVAQKLFDTMREMVDTDLTLESAEGVIDALKELVYWEAILPRKINEE